MRMARLLVIIGLPVALARAEPLVPTEDGTTSQYEMTEELGGPAAAPPTASSVVIRIGRHNLGG